MFGKTQALESVEDKHQLHALRSDGAWLSPWLTMVRISRAGSQRWGRKGGARESCSPPDAFWGTIIVCPAMQLIEDGD